MTETVDDVLAHFGVKGMKWGVRKPDTARQESFRKADKERGKLKRGATKANVALKAGSKVIDEGEKKLIFLPEGKRAKAAANTQSRVLGEARAVNKDPKFKGKDLKKDENLKAEYHKEIEKRAKTIYKEELSAVRVEAALEFVQAVTSPRADSVSFTAPKDRVRHADSDPDVEVLLKLRFVKNELDHVIDIEVADDDELEQSDDTSLEDALMHYGVKGMKWGVRKTAAERSAPSEVKVKSKLARGGATDIQVKAKAGRGVVSTKGGRKNVAADDAVQAKASRQKAKASTTDALSNAELKKVVERMQLEQKYRELQKKEPKVKKGQDFLKQLFEEGPKLVDALKKVNGNG